MSHRASTERCIPIGRRTISQMAFPSRWFVLAVMTSSIHKDRAQQFIPKGIRQIHSYFPPLRASPARWLNLGRPRTLWVVWGQVWQNSSLLSS